MTNTVFPNNINKMYVELSDRCNARCPMCHRNQYGGKDAEYITNTDISLEQFKTWFPKEFLQQLESIFFGDIGEPIMNDDCLEIFKYIKESNRDCLIRIYTNGSLRDKDFWASLSKVLTYKDLVTFAIDGFSDTHSHYRIGTDFNKVMENSVSFIKNYGNAKADIFVFEHNEHQVDDLTIFLYKNGFNLVNARSTDRFHGFSSFPVKDTEGNTIYNIYPAKNVKWKNFNVDYEKVLNTDLSSVNIHPKCFGNTSIYVNSRGKVSPCSWVSGSSENGYVDNWCRSDTETKLRQKMHESSISLESKITNIQLSNIDILTELRNSNWLTELPNNWNKHFLCQLNCGTNVRDFLQ